MRKTNISQDLKEIKLVTGSTLKTALEYKMAKFVNTILPSTVNTPYRNSIFLSGTSICDIYHGEEERDLDFFMQTKRMAIHIFNQLKADPRYSNTLKYIYLDENPESEVTEGFRLIQKFPEPEEGKLGILNETSLPMCLNFDSDLESGITQITNRSISFGKYQLVFFNIGKPQDIVPKFDFAHTQAVYLKSKSSEYSLVIAKDSFYPFINRELVIKTYDTPVATILRSYKFCDRGYKSPQGRPMAKLLEVLANTDVNDITEYLSVS